MALKSNTIFNDGISSQNETFFKKISEKILYLHMKCLWTAIILEEIQMKCLRTAKIRREWIPNKTQRLFSKSFSNITISIYDRHYITKWILFYKNFRKNTLFTYEMFMNCNIWKKLDSYGCCTNHPTRKMTLPSEPLWNCPAKR